MPLLNIPSGYGFTRNPIVITDGSPATAYDSRGGRFVVTLDGLEVYVGRFYPPTRIDISEILDAYIAPFTELKADEPGIYPMECIEDMMNLSCRRVSIEMEYDGHEGVMNLTAVYGGVSRQNYRHYVNAGTDAFKARFLNPKGNFFLTTRTAGWRIVVKETELYPFYFIAPNGWGDFELKDVVTGDVCSMGGQDGGVWTLDLNKVRQTFMSEYSTIPSIIDVYVEGNFSCRIIIEQADNVRERYRLKFRNSLGVFEIIDITGMARLSPVYDSDDDTAFKRYDRVTGCFYSDRERLEMGKYMEIDTLVTSIDRLSFLEDMISSDEVYLVDVYSDPVKVIPSIENMSYNFNLDEPVPITLKLEMDQYEINILPDISSTDVCHKPRVFSKQFSKQFK